MTKPQVITALSNLLGNRAIKKEVIPIELPKATDDFFNDGTKRTQKRTKHRYVIQSAGHRKLAYWEWKYQLYTQWQCPWSDDYNTPYYEEMTRIIKIDLRLPIS